MFHKSDTRFADMAVITEQRRRMISSRQNARVVLFWCAIIITIAAVFNASGGHPFVLLGVGATIQWMLVFYFDSEVRMLMVVDRFGHSKPSGDPA